MHIDWWTLGLQTVNVLVLVWLLARYLFRPVARIVAERQQAAAALMADAAAAKADALAERKQAAEHDASIVAARGKVLEAAASEAAALKSSIESAARADIGKLRAAAEAGMETARQDAAAADARRASRLAIDIAAKLLERLPAPVRITGFIDGLAAGLQKLPQATRDELGRDGAALQLSAPRPLAPDELAACRGAIAHALGRDVTLRISVDPAIIAGLELDAPHAVLRNSLRHDLARLETDLLAHDTDHA